MKDGKDGVTFQQQALEINLPGKNFNPNAVPTTGSEYLTYMAYERKNTPVIMSRRPVIKDYIHAQQAGKQCILRRHEFACNTNARNCSQKWKQLQIQNFHNVREQIILMREVCQLNENIQFPSGEDSSAWLEFCMKNSPILSTILKLGQRDLEKLLKTIFEWLEITDQEAKASITTEIYDSEINDLDKKKFGMSSYTNTIDGWDLSQEDNRESALIINSQFIMNLNTVWLGQWFYALLACLSLPLEPDVHSNLREIARTCVRQCAKLKRTKKNEQRIATYNMFTHLIANVFGQLDFAGCV